MGLQLQEQSKASGLIHREVKTGREASALIEKLGLFTDVKIKYKKQRKN